jgi:spore coat protein A
MLVEVCQRLLPWGDFVLPDRRDFLKLCASSVPALLLPRIVDAGVTQAASSPASPYRLPAKVDKYIDRLPILRRMTPHSSHKDRDEYHIRMLEFQRPMHSQLPPTRLWGYEGQYPGPVIDCFKDKTVMVQWENQLPVKHLFAIDPTIHGAMGNTPAVRTVPHVHGSKSRSISDGLPEKWFVPGTSALYTYPNNQQAATLWYHDHAVGITRLNVYAGLSGFFLLRDEQERSMNLPAGDYEIPLILQDRTLDDQGQLVYAPTHDDGIKLPPGVWGPEFFGDLPVVNGAIYPYMEVEPRSYRLRILNSCNSRFLHLSLNMAKGPTDIPQLVTLQQIGSDGGFLPKPTAINALLMAPAERADFIVDFSGHEGRTVTLANNAPVPFPGWDMSSASHEPLYEFMQFRVTRPLTPGGKAFSLPTGAPFTRLQESEAVVTREFVLVEALDDQGHSHGVRIDGKGYDDPVTEFVKLGSVEKWRFINMTEDAHPMHIHLIQFQVLHRQGFNAVTFRTTGKLELLGAPRLPQPSEAGWKDTAIVNPRDVLTVIARFEGYTGRYVFHCHMLEHEDNDMMRPFEVVPEDWKPDPSAPVEKPRPAMNMQTPGAPMNMPQALPGQTHP